MESRIQLCLKDKDYYSFKTECSCFSHDLHVCFDNNEYGTNLTLNDQVYIDEEFCSNSNIFKKIFTRIKYACKCLFSGGFDIEYSFYFKDKQHVSEFVEYINRGYKIINHEKEFDIDNIDISKFPFGFYIDNLTFDIVDESTVIEDDHNIKHINVKFNNNGAGTFPVLSFKNENDEYIEMEFEPESMKTFGELFDKISKTIDKIYDKSYNECKK